MFGIIPPQFTFLYFDIAIESDSSERKKTLIPSEVDTLPATSFSPVFLLV